MLVVVCVLLTIDHLLTTQMPKDCAASGYILTALTLFEGVFFFFEETKKGMLQPLWVLKMFCVSLSRKQDFIIYSANSIERPWIFWGSHQRYYAEHWKCVFESSKKCFYKPSLLSEHCVRDENFQADFSFS